MRYNILTVASKSYFPFIDIFLNSLFKNADTSKLNKIYIVAVDLDDYKNYLYSSPKIVYLDNGQSDEYAGVHLNGWYNNTKLKTDYLKDILNEIPSDESLVMIDSDTVILKDFYDIINKEYDVQITQMSSGAHISASDVLILHIACFIIFNNIEKSKLFVEKWIQNKKMLLENGKNRPHETPAMNLTLQDQDFMKNIKIESLDDKIVCADKAVYPQSKIIHLKSAGELKKDTPLNNFKTRFEKVDYYGVDKNDINYSKYLQKKPFKLWCNEDFNVSKDNFYGIQKLYKINFK